MKTQIQIRCPECGNEDPRNFEARKTSRTYYPVLGAQENVLFAGETFSNEGQDDYDLRCFKCGHHMDLPGNVHMVEHVFELPKE